MEKINPTICVFCGSSFGANPNFRVAARELGKCIAASGFDLVYGGGSVGLMGEVAKAALAGGAEVKGIIPDFLHRREMPAAEFSTKLVVTGSMHERKSSMFDLSDAFIALPGGIGTVEETVEVLTWAQLKIHQRPIGLVNVDGYWNPLISPSEHAINSGFSEKSILKPLVVQDNPGAVIAEISHRLGLNS